MARLSEGRRAALEILRAAERGRRLDLALDEALRDVPVRERSWVHELTYGVVRLRARLDHLLDHHLHAGVESVSPLLLQVLRIGTYQLLRMEGVPAYAAVSQSVEQAKREVGPGVAGLANGVLRSVQRTGEDRSLFPRLEEDPVRHLATWGSHPEWLVRRWSERWGTEATARLVDLNNRPPELSVRPLGLPLRHAVERLGERGIEAAPVGRGSGSLRVSGGDPAEVLAAIPAVVQDPGASLVVEYADPSRGTRVADLCAAPGGKALALAVRASYLLAADPSRPRLALVDRNVRRVAEAVGSVGTVVARAEAPPVRDLDLVLLDVPCTGTGTLRRHPDARWRLDPGAIDRMAGLQSRILEGAAGTVRPGGLLVYATCTLEPEENEERVWSFLDRHEEFEMEPGDAVSPELIDRHGFLRVLPQDTGFDGAFAARMRRTE